MSFSIKKLYNKLKLDRERDDKFNDSLMDQDDRDDRDDRDDSFNKFNDPFSKSNHRDRVNSLSITRKRINSLSLDDYAWGNNGSNNGSGFNGSGVNTGLINGPGVNGSGVNTGLINGPGSNNGPGLISGSGVNGPGVNNGSNNAPGLINGPAVNNGSNNGSGFNGSGVNTGLVNGPGVNGSGVNTGLVNGSGVNGSDFNNGPGVKITTVNFQTGINDTSAKNIGNDTSAKRNDTSTISAKRKDTITTIGDEYDTSTKTNDTSAKYNENDTSTRRNDTSTTIGDEYDTSAKTKDTTTKTNNTSTNDTSAIKSGNTNYLVDNISNNINGHQVFKSGGNFGVNFGVNICGVIDESYKVDNSPLTNLKSLRSDVSMGDLPNNGRLSKSGINGVENNSIADDASNALSHDFADNASNKLSFAAFSPENMFSNPIYTGNTDFLNTVTNSDFKLDSNTVANSDFKSDSKVNKIGNHQVNDITTNDQNTLYSEKTAFSKLSDITNHKSRPTLKIPKSRSNQITSPTRWKFGRNASSPKGEDITSPTFSSWRKLHSLYHSAKGNLAEISSLKDSPGSPSHRITSLYNSTKNDLIHDDPKSPDSPTRPNQIRRIHSLYQTTKEKDAYQEIKSNLLNLGIKISNPPNSLFPKISSQELSNLLINGNQNFSKILVVDCRFSYEFEGGHIKNAKNLTDKSKLLNFFNENLSNENQLIVFHCEFSILRGPTIAQKFRQLDRQKNLDNYPYLSYPDIIILDGGYSNFFNNHKSLCVGEYIEMKNTKYEEICHSELNKVKKDSRLTRAKSYNFFNLNSNASSALVPSNQLFHDHFRSRSYTTITSEKIIKRQKSSSNITSPINSKQKLLSRNNFSSYDLNSPLNTTFFDDNDFHPPVTPFGQVHRKSHSSSYSSFSLSNSSINSSLSSLSSDNDLASGNESSAECSSPIGEFEEFYGNRPNQKKITKRTSNLNLNNSTKETLQIESTHVESYQFPNSKKGSRPSLRILNSSNKSFSTSSLLNSSPVISQLLDKSEVSSMESLTSSHQSSIFLDNGNLPYLHTENNRFPKYSHNEKRSGSLLSAGKAINTKSFDICEVDEENGNGSMEYYNDDTMIIETE